MSRFTCEICGEETSRIFQVALRSEGPALIAEWMAEYESKTAEWMVLVSHRIDTCGMNDCTKTARTTGAPGKAYPRWSPR